jgi:signal transduction histidine kinase
VRAFDRREPFKMEYRLRRHDGEYRWILDIGVPQYHPDDGTFLGYVGSCTDITDHKLAEEALSNVSSRLIRAQEEERMRIARELHDDINQRIAFLGIDLAKIETDIPGLEMQQHILQLQQRITELSLDVQSLSHRLHSSKLDYMGIVVAARSFCRELSEQHAVKVEFRHAGIPCDIPNEIALSLYRVLQEALQNAVKHSHTRLFQVELKGGPAEIQLTVSDQGVGFNPQDRIMRHGLGLISMRERLQLVNGELSIQAKPGCGATIRARVPLAQSGALKALARKTG